MSIKTNNSKVNSELHDKYFELIHAVESKYPNETRHETALRYIQERERFKETAAQVIKELDI